MSRFKSFRSDKKSPLFEQDYSYTDQKKLQVIQWLRGSHPSFPGKEELLDLFKEDLEFIGSCLSTCMQTNQVFLYESEAHCYGKVP